MDKSSIIRWLNEHYGLNPRAIKDLAGYENHNYLVEAPHKKYVLKTYPWTAETESLIEAENRLLLYLGSRSGLAVPQPVRTSKDVLHGVDGDRKTIFRLLTFLDGIFLGDINPTRESWNSLGAALARIDKELEKYVSPVHSARRYYWDLNHPELSYDRLEDIEDTSHRKYVEYFFLHFEQEVRPKVAAMRSQIIYADANEWNLLTNGRSITGLIDFGDVVESALINELAVAITYVMMDRKDPLADAEQVVKAYHQHNPLLQEELDLLYYLVGTRLGISLCSSARGRKLDPENAYLTVSEKPAWDLIQRWSAMNPREVSNRFRRICDFESRSYEQMDKVLSKRNQYLGGGLSVSYLRPIHMERAAFQYMFDYEGNAYLDAYNNIPHVGHEHPAVVKAGQRQMSRLNTNTRYIYDQLGEYAEKLLSYFPDPLKKVFFVNSGSAASDLAVRLATNYTGKSKMAVIRYGYHGNSRAGIDISHYKYASRGGHGTPEQVIELEIPDIFRGEYRGADAGKLFAGDAINKLESDKDVAAFIAEPVIGCGGQVPLPVGYLPGIYDTVREQSGVCISDEVQTGFGRLGEVFWGFELSDVIPDIVVLGKPMGNGHPVGAVVTTTEISDAFDNGMEFFSSFGGNPVSCVIGREVLKVLEEEKLRENATKTGNHFKKLLGELKSEFPEIGDVRGSGLFLGVELIENEELVPATELAAELKNRLREKFILVSTDGPWDNVIKMKPPLCFSQENAEQVVDRMREILRSLRS